MRTNQICWFNHTQNKASILFARGRVLSSRSSHWFHGPRADELCLAVGIDSINQYRLSGMVNIDHIQRECFQNNQILLFHCYLCCLGIFRFWLLALHSVRRPRRCSSNASDRLQLVNSDFDVGHCLRSVVYLSEAFPSSDTTTLEPINQQQCPLRGEPAKCGWALITHDLFLNGFNEKVRLLLSSFRRPVSGFCSICEYCLVSVVNW